MVASNTRAVDFEDALTEQKIITTLNQLQAIPEPDQFKRFVEDELWAAFVPQEYHDEETVSLTDLPVHKRALIGYIDQDGATLPWWFEKFTWEFVYGDNVVLTVPDDPLSDLEQLQRGSPSVRKPSFSEECSIYITLESFSTIQDFLSSHTDTESDNDFDDEVDDSLLRLHRQIQSENDDSRSESSVITPIHSDDEGINWIQTSDGFGRWVKSVIELIPPNNETLTALMLANCGLDKKHIAGVSSITEDLNSILGSASWNNYKKAMNAFAGVLAWEGALDLSIGESDTTLTALEESLYRAWHSKVENSTDSDKVTKVIQAAKRNEKDLDGARRHARQILALPVRRYDDRYSFVSTEIFRGGSDRTGSETRAEIYNLLTGEVPDEG